jgi:hypothetical protein
MFSSAVGGFADENVHCAAGLAVVGITLYVREQVQQNLRQKSAIAHPRCGRRVGKQTVNFDRELRLARVDREQTNDFVDDFDQRQCFLRIGNMTH